MIRTCTYLCSSN